MILGTGIFGEMLWTPLTFCCVLGFPGMTNLWLLPRLTNYRNWGRVSCLTIRYLFRIGLFSPKFEFASICGVILTLIRPTFKGDWTQCHREYLTPLFFTHSFVSNIPTITFIWYYRWDIFLTTLPSYPCLTNSS